VTPPLLNPRRRTAWGINRELFDGACAETEGMPSFFSAEKRLRLFCLGGAG
jgi:hypothetical protein